MNKYTLNTVSSAIKYKSVWKFKKAHAFGNHINYVIEAYNNGKSNGRN